MYNKRKLFRGIKTGSKKKVFLLVYFKLVSKYYTFHILLPIHSVVQLTYFKITDPTY